MLFWLNFPLQRMLGHWARHWPLPFLPYPHFMSLAPLDVWLRLLFGPLARVPLVYWPRLCCALAVSALATAVTLPERVLLALFLRLRRHIPDPRRAPVFILGYYRSGTTHLQNVLNEDPNLFSPTWVHTLAPQGFVLSWTFFRFFLIPFMSSTRLVDPTLLGPDVPSEDDFALNNWTLASALPGRAILTRAHRFYARFHDLRALAPAELSRWRRYQLAFARKLILISGKRRLLLKTPSHTARIDFLLELFPGAKFIHVTRHPTAVIRSNLGLLRTVQRLYNLQSPQPREQIEQNLLQEYIATEENYLTARRNIPRGDLAEVRFQDLLADPIGEIKRIYRELDLPYTETFEDRLLKYLSSMQTYAANVYQDWTEDQARRLTTALMPLIREFRHDEPAVPAERPLIEAESSTGKTPILSGLAAALACALTWIIVATLLHKRYDWLVWPTGIAIGYATLCVARAGTRGLGLWSAFLTLLVLLSVAFCNTQLVDFAGRHSVSLTAVVTRTIRKLIQTSHLFWSFMGLMTAYRLGSRPRS